MHGEEREIAVEKPDKHVVEGLAVVAKANDVVARQQHLFLKNPEIKLGGDHAGS